MLCQIAPVVIMPGMVSTQMPWLRWHRNTSCDDAWHGLNSNAMVAVAQKRAHLDEAEGLLLTREQAPGLVPGGGPPLCPDVLISVPSQTWSLKPPS